MFILAFYVFMHAYTDNDNYEKIIKLKSNNLFSISLSILAYLH